MAEANLILKRTKSEEVFFILSGNVLNKESKRIFSTGALIGETDIIFKRDRRETYMAISTVYTLMFDAATILELMDEFPDIF